MKRKKSDIEMETNQDAAKEAMKKPENLLNTLALDPITLKVGTKLSPIN